MTLSVGHTGSGPEGLRGPKRRLQRFWCHRCEQSSRPAVHALDLELGIESFPRGAQKETAPAPAAMMMLTNDELVSMTVAEVIGLLNEYPPDLIVVVPTVVEIDDGDHQFASLLDTMLVFAVCWQLNRQRLLVALFALLFPVTECFFSRGMAESPSTSG